MNNVPFRAIFFFIVTALPVSTVFAAANQGGEGSQSFLVQMLPFAAIIVIFYFFIIRPQHKKQKQHREMLTKLKRGDQVILSSGIHGRIEKAAEGKDYIIVSIGESVTVKVQKDHITVVNPNEKKDERSGGKKFKQSEKSLAKDVAVIEDDEQADDTKKPGQAPRRNPRRRRPNRPKNQTNGDAAVEQEKSSPDQAKPETVEAASGSDQAKPETVEAASGSGDAKSDNT